jgi:hypothetical protein
MPDSTGSGKTKVQTLEDIKTMYGLVSTEGCSNDLSQVTISSDDVEVDCNSLVKVPEKDCQSPVKLNEKDCNSLGYYFDHMKCCLVRTQRTKNAEMLTDMSTMKEGAEGFALACFADGEEVQTDIPNLQLFGQIPHGLKRPAAFKRPAALKRPAKADPALSDETLQSEDDHEEESDVPVASDGLERPASSLDVPLVKPGKASPLLHTFPGGTEMKLGKFTGQSYITFKRPGEAKYILLVCCSSSRAARNGKDHHSIMDTVWDKMKGKPNMMTKDECKQLVVDLLLE